VTWFAYEDAIHRRQPGVVAERLDDLARRGISATPAHPSADHTIDAERQAYLKREAVYAYESQLRAFGPKGYEDVFRAEHYWQLSVSRAPGRRSSPAR
jgi:hypothetical protein